MYIVTIENNGVETRIHDASEKLSSGKIVKGINAIDSFSFSILPSNAGFELLHDFTTLVKVYNTNRGRYDFAGRVLYSDTTMHDSGLITKDVTCESYFGFLCDSQQDVVGIKNWTVTGLLQHLIDAHNAQVEDYKRFTIGTVTVTDPNDNLYVGIQYANTWDAIKEKLLDKLGGEIRFRVEDGVTYLDYLVEIGKVSTTQIALSHNMKSIKQERDPSSYITRLIPLGMKMGENDERLQITEVNGGKNYIDDENAIAQYGIHVGYHEWDDVTVAANLLTKGQAWLQENNKLLIKYSITALDLSLLDLDIDDFDVGNYHPIKNALMGIDDTARIVKKNIDICEEVRSTIEVGDNLQSMSDIQISQAQEQAKIYSKITKSNEEIKLEVKNEVERLESSIAQTAKDLTLTTTCENGSATVKLSATAEDGTKVEISSDTFEVNVDAMNVSGKLKADQIDASELKVDAANITGELVVGQQLPENLATTEDIPTSTSDLTNDSGFQTATQVTKITQDEIRTANISAEQITTGNLSASRISGGTLDCDDMTVKNLSADSINAGYISANRVDDGRLDSDLMDLACGSGGFCSGSGSTDVGETSGAMMYAIDGFSIENYVYVSDAGVRLQSEDAELWISDDNVFYSSCSNPVWGSDRRIKNTITYDMEKYEALFHKLKPCFYKLNASPDGRFNIGFIAQDVEDALAESSLAWSDFAGVTKVKSKNPDGTESEETYALGYSQFTSLNTHMLQKLYARVEELENKLKALEGNA